MSKITKTIQICDCCNKEIKGRLITHTCPCCAMEICNKCQEKEDSRHKPREKKQKAEQVPPPEEVAPEVPVTKPSRKKKARSPEVEPEIADKKGDNLTIHVPTGLGDDVKYKVNIAGFEVTGFLLKETVLAALEGYEGNIPTFLSDYERETLQGILDAAK